MGIIVCMVNTKGGVGKSTCAVHYAEWMRRRGQKVILIDSDRQGSAASWAVWRATEAKKPTPEISRLYDRDLFVQMPAFKQRYDRIVIDTRGADGSGTRAALVVSQLAVVPVRDSDFDAAALEDLVALLQEARSVNPEIKACAYLSQIDIRRAFPKEIKDYLQEVGLVPFGTVIHYRAAYARAVRGLTVFELEDAKAREEMQKLCEEIEHELR